MVNLGKITKDGKAIYLAYDHGLEHGPVDFSEESVNPNYILDIAQAAGFQGVVLQKGVAEKYYTGTKYARLIPLILKLNGKTSFITQEPYSPQICQVDEAVKLGAAAVGYTVYVGSGRQDLMFAEFSKIVREAHNIGLPVIGWMYPRGSTIAKETPEITAYAARIGLELGADVVKVKYTGSAKSFSWVVKSARPVRVLMSGGERESLANFLQAVREVMEAGGAGVAVGRNVWQSEDPIGVSKTLTGIVFGRV